MNKNQFDDILFIFSTNVEWSGRTPQNLSFKYNGSEIEVVKNFNYLGIILSKTGNFNLAKKRLVDKAVVSMYAVLKLGRKHNLSIKCLLSLFDKMVKPTLLWLRNMGIWKQ
jgi:hypothetical protein